MVPSGTLVFGQKVLKSAFFHVLVGELTHFLAKWPKILQGIVFSHIQLDSSLKSPIFDAGGATAQIRRERVSLQKRYGNILSLIITWSFVIISWYVGGN